MGPGTTRNGVPLMKVVVPTVGLPGPVDGIGITVVPGITRNGTPLIVVVAPTTPDGT